MSGGQLDPNDPQKSSIDTEHSGLFGSAVTVSVMTMLSRVLGLVRDVTFAFVIGASAGADAFFVAFKIPNFFRRLFAEGAFNQAFVPVLAEYKERATHGEVRALIGAVSGMLASVLCVITALAVIASPMLVWVFAPGWAANDVVKANLAADLLRWTFPYLLFISLAAFLGSILNTWRRFAVPALTPVLLNVCLIASACWLTPLASPPVKALAWGVMFAGVVQVAFQCPFVYRLNLLALPKISPLHPGVKKIIMLMLPALFGVSVAQINLLLDTILASFLVNGSVSWLYYSDRLVELPLGVFGIAIATVILPTLSSIFSRQQSDEFAATLDWAIQWVLLLGLPAALALFVLAEPLLITLFHYGSFAAGDVGHAASSLRAYSLGLVAFMLIKVLSPGYFSRQDTKTPVRIGVVAMLANMVMNLALIGPLAHTGLALATSLSAFLNAGLLYKGLRREGWMKHRHGWRRFLFVLVVGVGVMMAVVGWLSPSTQWWLDQSWLSRCLRLAGVVGAGLFSFVICLFGLGLKVEYLRAPASDM